MTSPEDTEIEAEIEALRVCLKALLPLDMAARKRVLDYLRDRVFAPLQMR